MIKHLSIGLLVFLTLFAIWTTLGQTPPTPRATVSTPPQDFLGSFKESKYTNAFFGLELAAPVDWSVVDQETTTATLKVGLEALKGKNERANAALEAAATREVVLIHLTKKPVGSIENASFMVAVVKQPSPAVLPTMVAEATKSALLGSPTIKVTKDTHSQELSGKKFAAVDYEVAIAGQVVKTKYYVSMVKGYSITIGMSYLHDADMKILQAILDSVRFSP